MDPSRFPVSTLALNHAPYGPILPERLVGANKGKIAVVTGAGQGIGRAISVALANSGATLALLDLKEELLQETKELCAKHDAKSEIFICDVTNPERVHAVFQDIQSKLGPVDVLVNNAGAASGRLAREDTFEGFWKLIEVNFKGSMLCIFEVLKPMRERKSGCIIQIASRAATVEYPRGLGYTSSKAAIARAVGTLQEEFEDEGLGQDIHTYSLHPGGVWTAMPAGGEVANTPEMRAMFKDPPELCGNTCAYLATGKAKSIRGLYFDCRQDVEKVASFGRETLLRKGLYTLTMNFLPGYENEP